MGIGGVLRNDTGAKLSFPLHKIEITTFILHSQSISPRNLTSSDSSSSKYSLVTPVFFFQVLRCIGLLLQVFKISRKFQYYIYNGANVTHSRRQLSLRHHLECFIYVLMSPPLGENSQYLQISCFVHVIPIDFIFFLLRQFANLPIQLKNGLG